MATTRSTTGQIEIGTWVQFLEAKEKTMAWYKGWITRVDKFTNKTDYAEEIYGYMIYIPLLKKSEWVNSENIVEIFQNDEKNKDAITYLKPPKLIKIGKTIKIDMGDKDFFGKVKYKSSEIKDQCYTIAILNEGNSLGITKNQLPKKIERYLTSENNNLYDKNDFLLN